MVVLFCNFCPSQLRCSTKLLFCPGVLSLAVLNWTEQSLATSSNPPKTTNKHLNKDKPRIGDKLQNCTSAIRCKGWRKWNNLEKLKTLPIVDFETDTPSFQQLRNESISAHSSNCIWAHVKWSDAETSIRCAILLPKNSCYCENWLPCVWRFQQGGHAFNLDCCVLFFISILISSAFQMFLNISLKQSKK